MTFAKRSFSGAFYTLVVLFAAPLRTLISTSCLIASMLAASGTHLKSSTRPSLYVGLMPMTGTVTFLVVRIILR